MKKVGILELSNKALNWVVSMIEVERLRATGEPVKQWAIDGYLEKPTDYVGDLIWGGEVIDREQISTLWRADENEWWACNREMDPSCGESLGYFGKTRQQAAMRCYVASVLGDEVDIPDGLM